MGVRPIVFSSPMVQALLDGRKTMTTRLVTSPLANVEPGDMLWVRESLAIDGRGVRYLADNAPCHVAPNVSQPLYEGAMPPMFMPRWASRIVLTVTGRIVRNLTAMQGEEFEAEGIIRQAGGFTWPGNDALYAKARLAFADLWDQLHAKPGARWDDDPKVVSIRFTVAKRSIDR